MLPQFEGEPALLLEALMADIPFLEVARIDVQWADVDRMQHVNNVVFFRWFETARTNYFDRLDFSANAGPKGGSSDVFPILVSIGCDFRAQVRQPDVVRVGYATTRIGRSSVAHAYQITSEQQQAVVAEGRGTWIWLQLPFKQQPPALPRAPLLQDHGAGSRKARSPLGAER